MPRKETISQFTSVPSQYLLSTPGTCSKETAAETQEGVRCESESLKCYPRLVQIKLKNDSSLASFQCGRIRHFQNFWKEITYDKEVLDKVGGMKIPIKEFIPKRKFPYQIPFNKEEKTILNVEIQKMLEKGIIIPVSNELEEGEFISTVFSRPKKSGGVRIILNLKEFNLSVEKKHFKMQTLQSAIELMKKMPIWRALITRMLIILFL